jgi:hypothetical protein
LFSDFVQLKRVNIKTAKVSLVISFINSFE